MVNQASPKVFVTLIYQYIYAWFEFDVDIMQSSLVFRIFPPKKQCLMMIILKTVFNDTVSQTAC
jgi:hypothetical protein